MRAAAILLTLSLAAPAHAAPARHHCLGEKATIVGTPGDDVLVARKPYEVVVGLGGNDSIGSTLGSRGRLFACGGSGNDWIRGTHDFDDLAGGAGSDTIYGRGQTDTISGGDGDDLIVGDSSGTARDRARADHDYIDGGRGDDRIFGFIGVDEIDAGDGDDFVSGGGHWDVIVPGPGDDDVRGGWGDDYVLYNDAPGPISVHLVRGSIAGEGNDTVASLEFVSGTAFDDRMTGSDRDEMLLGGGGSDVLAGLGGDDMLLPDMVASGYGGVIPHEGAPIGDDVVDGGDGTDLLMYSGWEPAALRIDLAAGTAEGHGSDVVSAIENVSAGAYDSIEIVGTDGPNLIYTHSGTADRVEGLGGDDEIYTQDGIDEIDGGEGFDVCSPAEVSHNCEAAEPPRSSGRRMLLWPLRLLSRATPAPPALATSARAGV